MEEKKKKSTANNNDENSCLEQERASTFFLLFEKLLYTSFESITRICAKLLYEKRRGRKRERIVFHNQFSFSQLFPTKTVNGPRQKSIMLYIYRCLLPSVTRVCRLSFDYNFVDCANPTRYKTPSMIPIVRHDDGERIKKTNNKRSVEIT